MSANISHLRPSLTSVGKLDGKVAIVTGSGSGFGETIAKRFAAEGANVVVAEINNDAGKRVQAEIANSLFVQTDVTKRDSWEQLLKSTVEKFGGLDILVNNAGTTYAKKPSDEVTDDEWTKLIDVNMKSIYLSVAVMVPHFKERKGGVILNTSSIGGLRVKDELVYYGASKTFVNKITEGLASEYGPHNIRINSVCPLLGYTGLTELFTGIKNTADFRAQFEATVPLRRGLSNEDIAKAALFLVSDDSAFITGVCLPVDGGSTCT